MNQDNDKSIDDGSDPQLSDMYREIASERAPEALNRAVLGEAARAAGNRTKVPGWWFRPLAFAATIGLTLAVVLQVNQTPLPDVPAAVEMDSMFEAEAAKSKNDDAPLEERKQAPIAGSNVNVEQQKPSLVDAPAADDELPLEFRSERLRVDDAAKKEMDEYADKLQIIRENNQYDADAIVEEERLYDDASVGRAAEVVNVASPPGPQSPEASAAVPARAADSAAPAAAATSANMENAAGITNNRARDTTVERQIAAEPDTEAAAAAEIDSAMSLSSFSTMPAACDEVRRAEADSWWECIEDLRAGGKASDADAELALFREAHPDYQPAN